MADEILNEQDETLEDAPEVSADEWHLRASMCELLAFSLRYPTMELAEAVSSGEWGDAANEIATIMGVNFLASEVEDHKGEDPEKLMHVLRTEATRLFIGAPNAAVSPYEGVWRAADDGVQALLFVNPHSMDVERFMKKCGLGRPEGTNEPLDHAATEFELLEYLAAVESGVAEPLEGAVAADKLPGGSAGEAYEQFMDEHPLTWMHRFGDKLAEDSRIAYFREVGRLVAAFMDTVE